MDTGPAGFRNAPLTKAIVLIVSTTSLLWLTGVIKPHRRPSKILLSIAFPQTGSLIFGLALLYQFRNLERQAGTSKHGALVGMGLVVQYLAMLFVHSGTHMPLRTFSPDLRLLDFVSPRDACHAAFLHLWREADGEGTYLP